MSLHRAFHIGLATRQISMSGQGEGETVEYAKYTVFGYVYQELKKQTRAKEKKQMPNCQQGFAQDLH